MGRKVLLTHGDTTLGPVVQALVNRAVESWFWMYLSQLSFLAPSPRMSIRNFFLRPLKIATRHMVEFSHIEIRIPHRELLMQVCREEDILTLCSTCLHEAGLVSMQILFSPARLCYRRLA